MKFPERLAIDRDLKWKLKKAETADKNEPLYTLVNRRGLNAKSIEGALELADDVVTAEVDRETNLNARGAAVAGVAGVIVSVSGFVGQSVFQTTDWTDWTKFVALGLFLAALFAVSTSMMMAVLGVLRPGRGHKSRSRRFLGETLVNLWILKRGGELVTADSDQLNLVRLDRFLRTLPVWHVRNRKKARWLRRAWVFLAVGILLIAIASVFVLGQALGLTSSQENGPAANLEFWWIGAFLVVISGLAWAAVRWDWVKAGKPKHPEDDEEQAHGEVIEIVKALNQAPKPVVHLRTRDVVLANVLRLRPRSSRGTHESS